jgi:hypothetical protein
MYQPAACSRRDSGTLLMVRFWLAADVLLSCAAVPSVPAGKTARCLPASWLLQAWQQPTTMPTWSQQHARQHTAAGAAAMCRFAAG